VRVAENHLERMCLVFKNMARKLAMGGVPLEDARQFADMVNSRINGARSRTTPTLSIILQSLCLLQHRSAGQGQAQTAPVWRFQRHQGVLQIFVSTTVGFH
jgi:hypothetical protein